MDNVIIFQNFFFEKFIDILNAFTRKQRVHEWLQGLWTQLLRNVFLNSRILSRGYSFV